MSHSEAGFRFLTAETLQQVFRCFSPWYATVERCIKLTILDFSMLAFGVFHILLVKPSAGTVSTSEGGTSCSVPFSLLHGCLQGISEHW